MRTIDTIAKMHHVRDAYRDSDGYWVIYRDGYVSPRTACALDHEDTAAAAIQAARETRNADVASDPRS